MTGQEALRAALRQAANRNSGVDVKLHRGFGNRVHLTGNETEMARLPVRPTQPLQDSVTGEMYFMVGFSDPFEEHVVM